MPIVRLFALLTLLAAGCNRDGSLPAQGTPDMAQAADIAEVKPDMVPPTDMATCPELPVVLSYLKPQGTTVRPGTPKVQMLVVKLVGLLQPECQVKILSLGYQMKGTATFHNQWWWNWIDDLLFDDGFIDEQGPKAERRPAEYTTSPARSAEVVFAIDTDPNATPGTTFGFDLTVVMYQMVATGEVKFLNRNLPIEGELFTYQ